MANFGNCINWVLRLEDRTLSGVVKDLGDGAGRTRFGVTEKNMPAWMSKTFFTDPVDQAIEEAKSYYQIRYWNPIRGLMYRTDEFAATLLAFAVNDGAGEAVKLLQGVLGLTQDGDFGPLTAAAVQAMPDEAIAAQRLREAGEAYYRAAVSAKPQDGRFLSGWVARARAVYPDLP